MRLETARSYWLCTTTPDGAPHAAPVWGVVINRVLYLYSERRTIKARNLAADPRVVVHLESADDVVIVRGTAEDRELLPRSPRWWRPCLRNTPVRGISSTCRMLTLISTSSMPSGRSQRRCGTYPITRAHSGGGHLEHTPPPGQSALPAA